MTPMAKRTALGTAALMLCLGGGSLALAGSANAQETKVPTGEFDKPAAVIASGDQAHLVDSVTAGPFASTLAANILLTPQDRMDASTYYYLSDNHIQVVYIVGGTGAVGQAVEDKIRSYGITVYRLAGADRYATAKVIADVNDLTWATASLWSCAWPAANQSRGPGAPAPAVGVLDQRSPDQRLGTVSQARRTPRPPAVPGPPWLVTGPHRRPERVTQ